MDISNLLFWFLPVLLNLLILIWCRFSCEVDSRTLHKFPSRGHIVIFTLLSFIPIFGAIEFCVWTVLYVSFRIEGSLKLKKNNFNKFWFDVNED